MSIKPNQIIDSRYKVLVKLGQGGMGEVWKATDQQLGDEVVIKMPLSNSDPTLLKRFGIEAQMMRKHSIGNPNIIDIQGVGDVDGTPYYVMRFLSGGSLEDRCPLVDTDGSAEFKVETFEWLSSIGKALDYLHANQVLHRDVKPANILFNHSGDAYLADFGIAKNPTDVTSFTQGATATGTTPGTFAYMAPEVLNPEPDMPAAGTVDQYALAVTLHETIAGRRPYDATNVIKLYHQTQKGCTPLRESFPSLTDAASQTIVRALSPDPADRFSSCRDFAESFLDGLGNKTSVVVGSPKVTKDDEDGTRELDLEEYRKNLKQQQPGDDSRAGDPVSLFAKPPASTTPQSVSQKPKSKAGLFVLLGVLLLGGGIFAAMNVSFTGGSSVAQADKQPVDLLAEEEARQQEAKRKEDAEARELEEADRLAKEEVDRLAKAKEVEEAARLAEAKAKEEVDRLAKEKEKLAQQKQRVADQARLAASVRLTAPFGQSEIETALTGLKRMNGLKPEITNSIGMRFRLIPAGTFMMGSPADEPGRHDNELQHEVRISNEFYLGVTEVTQGQWKSVMGTEPWQGRKLNLVKEGKNYSASYVSWDDAVEFCEKLSSKDGVKYRLPTEAEWEYACRGGSDSAYSFGNDPSELSKYGWFTENANEIGEVAHEVGLKLGNGFGLYDMHGNVWEWCSDNYASDYYGTSPRTDPLGPDDVADQIKSGVTRGGSWNFSALSCRSANRGGDSTGRRDYSLGFRVLRSSIHKAYEEARKTQDARREVERLEQIAAENKRREDAKRKEEERAKAIEEAARMAKEQEKLAQEKQEAQERARLAESVRLTAPFGKSEIETALEGLKRMNGWKPEITNSIGMKFRLIPAGTFMMGSPPNRKRRLAYEVDQHEVSISEAFYLGATEVTQGQWKEVMGGTDFWKKYWRGKNYAASYVSWDDAMEFCKKLSAREGVDYRLPTEAEWEYACRSGSQSAYSFGDDPAELGKYAWFDDNTLDKGERYAHEVDLKLSNSFGLHNMHGNLIEWCGGLGFDRGHGREYFQRGGTYFSNDVNCRSVARHWHSPDYASSGTGFRVLRSTGKKHGK